MAKPNNVIDLSGHRQQARRRLLNKLFEEHGGPLRSFLAGRLGSRADLDDVVQDVFVRLARLSDLSDKVLNNKGSCRAYLFTIGNNLAVDLKRKNQVRKLYVDVHQGLKSEQSKQQSPETIIAARQDLEVVKQAIAKMPAAWRRVFLLSRVELLSYRQIAEQLNVSVKQIEKYMSKALKCVRDEIQKSHQNGDGSD
ncbi:RNA polymerase sigma factor [Porticoccus sp. GXU_MW_L64]